jgi:hypothetical protein
LKADPRFLLQSREFWAHVRTISQEVGYTKRREKSILVPSLEQVRGAFERLELSTEHIVDADGALTSFGATLFDYFAWRAATLNDQVRRNLMDKQAAAKEFERLRRRLKPHCPLPMNKQKGDKRTPMYLTGMVNMLIEANIGAATCDYDPRSLTTITKDRMPLRTLSRRVDGAFPEVVNPIAIWEVKEYYSTKTFGSRVADGVYETLLDGIELEELEVAAGRKVQHVLFVDDEFTWWQCGRSYLCRILDMLHMGYVDEVIFGREVLIRLPEIARGWVSSLKARTRLTSPQGKRRPAR